MSKSICKKCSAEHEDRRSAYCPACAEEVRLDFGRAKGHGVRLNLRGDDNRPRVRVVPEAVR
jgi:hypothetical protein